MPNVISIVLGAFFTAILILVCRELIEEFADRKLPFVSAPWQNSLLQIALWLVLLFMMTGLCFYFGTPIFI